jgi:hypothetical protein
LREYCSPPKNRILPVTGHFWVDSLEPELGSCSPGTSIVVLSEDDPETLFIATDGAGLARQNVVGVMGIFQQLSELSVHN